MTQTQGGVNATIEKFGFPHTRIAETQHWMVLLRPKQATLGALVLAAKHGAEAFGDLPPAAFADLQEATGKIETALSAAFGYQKLNYLMLMMVDPHVHFHVLPRYDSDAHFEGRVFEDPGWPGPPDLKTAPDLDEAALEAIRLQIASRWPG
nr:MULTISPECIES: HIT family protein [Euryhalocaulis]